MFVLTQSQAVFAKKRKARQMCGLAYGPGIEPGTWVLLYRLADGRLEEREIPRWESDENAARSRRARFRVVTTYPSTSRREP